MFTWCKAYIVSAHLSNRLIKAFANIYPNQQVILKPCIVLKANQVKIRQPFTSLRIIQVKTGFIQALTSKSRSIEDQSLNILYYLIVERLTKSHSQNIRKGPIQFELIEYHRKAKDLEILNLERTEKSKKNF